jgi:Ras-related protein Rab-1A
MYCKDSDGGLAIFDLGDRDAFGEIGAFIKEFRQWTVQDQPTVLVGNKSDLVTERKVTSVEGMDLAKQLNIPYMETSAFNAINVEEAFIILIKNILKKKENMLKAFTNLSLKEISK